MKAGEIWIHKKREDIQLKILEYTINDNWLVVYVNTYGDDGSPYDELSGEEIYEKFYKSN